MKKILAIVILTFTCATSDAQILISLIFGDKLNSDKMEFGLDGGINLPTIRGEENGKVAGQLNLGFYFDLKFKNRDWMIHTGIIGLSVMGTRGLPVYSLNNSLLDSAFTGGSIERELRYFNLPVMLKRVFKKRFFVQGGIMAGLNYSALDIFKKKVLDSEDLQYTLDIKDHVTRIDFGFMAGVGYRLLGGNGMNLAIRYYHGIVPINNNDDVDDLFNRSVYLAVGIPVGAGGKKKVPKPAE